VLAIVPVAAGAREAQVSLHVPVLRLADALAEISRRSGVQIVTSVPADLRTTHPVRGRFGVDEAIRQVTDRLPVTVRQVPGGYLVTPAPAPMPVTVPLPGPGQLVVQEPPAEPIVVTGYRESLRQAVAVKRAARSTLEVTRAEDIAAFPDHNAADALQRLPGIAISRDNGRSRCAGWARCSPAPR